MQTILASMVTRVAVILLTCCLFSLKAQAQQWQSLNKPYWYVFDAQKPLRLNLTSVAVKFLPELYTSTLQMNLAKDRLRTAVPDLDINREEVQTGPRDERLSIFPVRGISTISGFTNLLQRLATMEGVEYATPEFTDSEGFRMVLTDEFTVELAVSPYDPEWQNLLKEYQLAARSDAYRSDVFYVKVSRTSPLDPLSMANFIFEQHRNLVRWVDLNSLDEIRWYDQVPIDSTSKQSAGAVASPRGANGTDELPPDRLVPLDEFFYGQYHLDQSSDYDLNAPEAWFLLQNNDSFRNGKIAIAVADQGLQGAYRTAAHPDYAVSAFKNFDPARDSAGNPAYPFPSAYVSGADADSHGTPIAGIVAARAKFPTFGTSNPTGVVGVIPGAKLMDLRIGRHNGMAPPEKLSDAFLWALINGVQVVSCSWGRRESSDLTSTIANVVYSGRNGLGMILVFATGNTATDTVSYPARLSQTYPVLAVGACSRTGTWQYSSYIGFPVDVVAPSDNNQYNLIWTTDLNGPRGFPQINPNLYNKLEYTDAFGGTSAATPQVAGVAALILCKNPFLTSTQIKATIRNTALPLGNPTRLGKGIARGYESLSGLQLPVANLTVSSPSCGTAYLQWSNTLPTFSESFFQAIELWGRPVGGTFAKLADITNKSATSHSQGGLGGNTTWEFKVRARGRLQLFLADYVEYFSDFSDVATVFVSGLAAPSSVSVESAPGYIKMNHSVVPGADRYDANASASPGGPFYPRGQSYTTLPGWINMTSCYPPCLVQEVDTNLYYWTANGWSGACPGGQSDPVGTVGAWHLKSASAVATKNNNQRKVARGNWQHHVMVFESGGDIFFTRSTNNGTTWLPEELVSVGNGLNANPAIEHLVYIVSPNSYNESYVVWEENPVGANGYRIWSRRRDNNQNTWDPIRLLHEDISNRPVAAQPVVSGFYTFWRGPNGLLWRYSGPSNFPTVYTLPGTDANSNAPSVEVTTFYGGTAHVAWEQAGAGIRYARGTVDINGGTWNPVISVANSSGLTTNAKPTVAENFSGNACIAWEYKFISTGSIKFRTVAPNGAMSSVTTFLNPPGSTRIPTSASLSSYRSSYTDDLTVTWHSPADGVIALYYRSGAWQSPFVVSPAAQHAHVNNTYVSSDNTRLAMFMGTSGSPYRVFTSALPSSTPAPRSPVLLSPANGATGVSVPATVAWDYVIGASTYRLQIDDNSDFSSPVLDVSGLTGTNHYASLNTWTTYYWRVNATSPYGTSAWSSVWSFTTGDPLPPSCPFVFTWNGEEFVEDNNILPQSLDPENAGVDVLDVYRLMKPPVARDGKYLLKIREDAEDYSRFDNFTLIAVDHPTAIEVAMKDDGTVIPYIKPFNLHRARYRDRDVLRELIAFDSLVVNTAPGDIVEFGFKRFSGGAGIKSDFGDPFGEANSSTDAGDKGGIEAGGSGEDEVTDAIGRPLLFSFNGGQTSMTQTQGAYFRHNPSLVYIPFTLFDTTNVQLAWSSSVNLDYLNLAMKVSARVATRELPLQKAIHNVAGDVTEQLASLDGMYAELAQGQSIELTFTAPTVPAGMKRTFFLVSTGRYEHLQGSPGNQLSQVSSSPSFAGVPTEYQLHQNHPNPFNPTTVIRFDLPIEGHVTLEVYDVLGRQVLTLLDDHRLAGYHQTVFDARGLSSGTYFYRLQAGDYVSVKKLLLLR